MLREFHEEGRLLAISITRLFSSHPESYEVFLKNNPWREECALVFVGYQPEGTLGRKIIDSAERVKIFGEDIAIRAKVYTINGFSSHADQNGLLEWLSYAGKPWSVFLIHGEEEKMKIFADAIKNQLGLKCSIPEEGQILEL